MKSERGFGRKVLCAVAAFAVLGAGASAQSLVKRNVLLRPPPRPAGGSLENDMRYNPVRKTGGLARANGVGPLRREITVSLHDDHLIVAGGSQGDTAVLDISFALAGGLMAVDGMTSGHFAADGSYVVELSQQFPQFQFKRLHARSAKIDGKLVTLVLDLEVEAAPFATWTALDRLDNPERAGAKIPARQLLVHPGKVKPR